MAEPSFRQIAVIGCGLMGASWAALFLAHGLRVTAWDPDQDSLDTLRARVAKLMRQLRELGANGRGRLVVEPDLRRAVADADLVQENAPERLSLKRKLYRELEAAMWPTAIIAASTSSLTWSDLSKEMKRRQRLVTAHPFNPPHLIPLVELYGPNARIVRRAAKFYRHLDKTVVVLKKEAAGHIANRLASALWREAVYIVAERIADVKDVDDALVDGPGLRWSIMGANMVYHLGGGAGGIRAYLEHLGPGQERRWKDLGKPKLTTALRGQIVRGVLAEAKGRTIEQLERQRDRILIDMLRARQRRPRI